MTRKEHPSMNVIVNSFQVICYQIHHAWYSVGKMSVLCYNRKYLLIWLKISVNMKIKQSVCTWTYEGNILIMYTRIVHLPSKSVCSSFYYRLICLSVRSPVCMYDCHNMPVVTCSPFIVLSVRLSDRPSVCPAVWLSVCPSIYPSVRLICISSCVSGVITCQKTFAFPTITTSFLFFKFKIIYNTCPNKSKQNALCANIEYHAIFTHISTSALPPSPTPSSQNFLVSLRTVYIMK